MENKYDIEYNNNYIDNHNNTIVGYTKGELQSMLIFIIFISCCSPFFHIINHILHECKLRYNFFKLSVRKIRIDDNLLLDECSICLEKYQKNDKITDLNCDHVFHTNCIRLWLKDNNTCPQCREIII